MVNVAREVVEANGIRKRTTVLVLGGKCRRYSGTS
ncbi:hypothetical protein OROMI_001496 [Orobanche minor]